MSAGAKEAASQRFKKMWVDKNTEQCFQLEIIISNNKFQEKIGLMINNQD